MVSQRLAAGLLLAAGGLAGCHARAGVQDPRLADRVVAVTTAIPSGARDGQYTGVVGARVQSDLGFRVAGKITERLVDAGQRVRRGQPLMRIDPTDYADALVAQTGAVEAARARWIQAAADERRFRNLVDTGAVSRSAYDQAEAAADSAKAQLDAAVAQQQVARDQAGYAVLVADADGVVMETLAEPGQVVSAGQVVARLAHAGPREAIVDLPETVRPALGSTATASLYDATVQVPARLRQLSDAADPRTRTFEARYVMDGAGAAAPLGSTVTIGFAGPGPAANTTSVPLGAIDDEGRGPGVWVVDPRSSRVSYRPVQVRALGGESAEIAGGVHAGEIVVATGGHELHAGETVRPTQVQAVMQ